MTATRAAEASAVRANGPAYAAFISYSRDTDGLLAPRLEYALERFATPWYRLRAFRVFRDDASLSTNPGLWSSLTGALDGVGYCILLASPGAADSLWVGREVEYWLEHRGPERLLIVLTGGEIVWDEQAGDFDWERTTALPRTIAGAYTEEPRYTDLRFAAHTEHVSVRDPRFRAAVADIAAPLHGIAKDDLIGEEVRQHKRTMRIARAAGISLALVTAAASVAAVLAIRSAGDANRERDRAERVANVATSRQLAAQSTVALQGDEIDGALDQAARSWRTSHTTEARDAVLAALKGASGIEATLHGPRPWQVGWSGERRKLAILDDNNRVTVLDLAMRKTVGEPLELRRPQDLVGIALDAHGERLAAGYGSGTVELWDLARRRARVIVRGRTPKPTDPVPADVPVSIPVFSADGSTLAWGGPGRRIFVWDGRRVRALTSPVARGEVPWDIDLSGDGRILVAAGAPDLKLVLWRFDQPGGPRLVPGGAPPVAMTSSGEHGEVALGAGPDPVLAIADADAGHVQLRDAASGRRLRVVKLRRGTIDSLAFSPGGQVVTVVGPRAVTVLGRYGERLGSVTSTGAEYGAAPLDETGRLATIAANGSVTVRAPAARESQLATPIEGAYAGTPVAFDPAGRRIAALDDEFRLRLWSASGGGRPLGRPLTGVIGPSELRFLPDGRVLTCCGSPPGDDDARVWDPGGAGLRGAQPPKGAGDTIDVGVKPDGGFVIMRLRGKTLTVSGASRPYAFDTGDYVGSLSPDGRWAEVVTEKSDQLWDLQRGRKLTDALPGYGIVTVSPKGPLLTVESPPIPLIDRFTGRRRGSLLDKDDNPEVVATAFSPDGRTLATLISRSATAGAGRAELQVWDVAHRTPVAREPLLARSTDIFSGALAFSPDGRRLAVVSDGGSMVFDLDVDHWAARACALSPTCSGRPGQAGR